MTTVSLRSLRARFGDNHTHGIPRNRTNPVWRKFFTQHTAARCFMLLEERLEGGSDDGELIGMGFSSFEVPNMSRLAVRCGFAISSLGAATLRFEIRRSVSNGALEVSEIPETEFGTFQYLMSPRSAVEVILDMFCSGMSAILRPQSAISIPVAILES